MRTYFAIVPIAHLVLEDLLLLRLEGLADTQPAATNGTANVADAALIGELASDVLISVALLLEVDDAGIIGIVVGLDRLRSGGLASRDTNVTQIAELGTLVRVNAILPKEVRLADCRP